MVEHPFPVGLLGARLFQILPDGGVIADRAAGKLRGPGRGAGAPVARHEQLLRLPFHRLCGIGAALEPGLREHRLGHEHQRIVRCRFAERRPLALVLRQTGKGDLGDEHRARIGIGLPRRPWRRPAPVVARRRPGLGMRDRGAEGEQREARGGQAHHSPSGSLSPVRRCAATSVLRSRQAMVIGPTPPGTGVIAPATAAHSL